MEIELKYLLNNKEQADEIMNSEFVSAITIPGTERTLDMDALYFDTEDLDLSAERISYRIRLEGDAYVATVKEKGQVDAGMHRRVEVNVDLPEGAPHDAADLELFAGTDVYDDLKRAAKGKQLVLISEMKFTRKLKLINTGKSISEISADSGFMQTGDKTAPIMEMEIELKEGDEADMAAAGEIIRKMFGLKEGNESKFKRALDLMEK
ncbi:MAG: CYTH domain-containing protein [Eubacteriales bacterium]|nr:CYTH domain-containing protein [Eubacteriales bacterium]